MNGTEVGTNEQTNEWKDQNYIPLGINAGGIITKLQISLQICRV